MKKNSFIIATILISISLSIGSFDTFGKEERDIETIYVSLGDEFILHQKQSAIIKNEDFEIKIIKFHNSPCPEFVTCIWSGVGIYFEYYHNQEVKGGINLVKAFGYKTTILETDHETFAKLMINKI